MTYQSNAVKEKSCGAILWRNSSGHREFLLIQHRSAKHWSFPKGHVEPGESEEATALREILEETGLEAVLDTGFRRVVTYSPKPGVVKDVVFFLGTPCGGKEHPQEEEVSQMKWLPGASAGSLVTFASDRLILQAAQEYLSAADDHL